jgi:transglutaminase-like putative cysteine protease
MKRINQSIRGGLSLLMVLSILMGLLATPVWATEPELSSDSVYNALCPESLIEETEQDEEDSAEAPSFGSSVTATYVNTQRAAEQLRDAMIARQSAVTLYIYSPVGVPDLKGTILPMAYSEELSNGIFAGDYLQWSWYKVSWDPLSYGNGQYVFQLKLQYYTTAAQEQAFQTELEDVLDSLDLEGKSDYTKYYEIYDYITTNVHYDTEALERVSDGFPQEGDYLIFTAYGALNNNWAVCQGYATLLYAMCRSLDLPVRVITGTGGGGNHAWNIVGLDGLYYNMDSTWDSDRPADKRNYFLRGSLNFDGHKASDAYLTSAFQATYPISQEDYQEVVNADTAWVMPFADVSESSYYYTPVAEMTERGLFEGVTSTSFQPGAYMNRAMLITVLWRMAGEPDVGTNSGFQDVPASSYYAKAVTWAASKGIAQGYTATTFRPSQNLTREQLVTFLYRYAQTMGYSTSAYNDLTKFADVSTTGSYAIPAFRWAVGAGIIEGISDTQLGPKRTATRAQGATMLYRFLNYYGI